MRHLNEIAEKMVSRAAAFAGVERRDGDGACLRPARRSAPLAAGLAAVPGLPLVLCAVLPVSVALPVGAALAGAVLLLGFAVSAARGGPREGAATVPVAPAEPAASSPYDLFAGLVTVHDPRGFVTAVHGRDRDAMLSWMRDPTGRGFIDQIHVSDRLGFVQAVDGLRLGAPPVTLDIRMDRQRMQAHAEQFVHMRVEMTGVAGADGKLVSIVAQSRDVSHEAVLRSETARKASEAESANDAKTRFLAAVSHELRTPLNAILGFSDILSGEYFGKLENDRQREYVALIHQSGSHLLSVVNTMLDVSKIEAGRYELLPEPFMVADSVRACEQMLGLQARDKGIQLTSRVQRGLGEAVADQRALQQVMINLVGNAIKFTDRGGVVTIDAAREEGDLVLTVSDTGIGIPADRLDALGQPFMQVENEYTRKYEGTGLGLSLVKGLVALHGGTFVIKSSPGEGTVITVRVPADGAGIEPAAGREGGEATVEFPPRLHRRANKATAGRTQLPPAAEDDEDAGHDDARAKTA